MSWRDAVLRVLRVPPTPTPPPGAPPRTFRASRSFFVLRIIRFLFVQAFAALGAVAGTVALIAAAREVDPRVRTWIQLVEILAWSAFLAQFFFALAVLRLDFELRWYMLSDRAIRVREGITAVREKTITLANVQNISIRQGPLQRILGIADVEVRTAGGGGSAGEQQKSRHEPGHVAYFRGVDNPEEIRSLLLEGVRRQKDAGLGDHDDQHGGHGDVTTAAAELLAEARKLRAAVGRI